jgi:hypothetical protein
MFAVPYAEIAPIVDRSGAATRQLASRARRRVRGAAVVPDVDLARQQAVVDAFFAAAPDGDFAALLAVLDPDIVVRADGGPVPALYAAAGVTWWLVEFSWDAISVDQVRGVIRDGPRDAR